MLESTPASHGRSDHAHFSGMFGPGFEISHRSGFFGSGSNVNCCIVGDRKKHVLLRSHECDTGSYSDTTSLPDIQVGAVLV